MHLDPDFENLTYGDNGKRRGSAIAKLTSSLVDLDNLVNFRHTRQAGEFATTSSLTHVEYTPVW